METFGGELGVDVLGHFVLGTFGGPGTEPAYVRDFVCIPAPLRVCEVSAARRVWAVVAPARVLGVPAVPRLVEVTVPDRWCVVPRRKNGCV